MNDSCTNQRCASEIALPIPQMNTSVLNPKSIYLFYALLIDARLAKCNCPFGSRMDLLNKLAASAPAPSTKLTDLVIKEQKIDTKELKIRTSNKQASKRISDKPNNEYLKPIADVANIKPVQHFKDQYGNTHMIVQKNDPLQVYGKQKKLPINTSQPIRIDHKTLDNKEDLKKWDIPPCVSNYKNPQGFVISLDKRMAASKQPGVVMNDKFGEIAEALYEADHKMKERLQNRRLQEQRVLKHQQQMIENELEELTKNKKILAGDKHDYDEFQKAEFEQRRKKRRHTQQEEPQLQHDVRLQFDNAGEEMNEKVDDVLNQKLLFEKEKK